MHEPRIDPFGRMAFILFFPDATTTGAYVRAIDHLQQKGLEFISYLWTRVTPQQITELYSPDDGRSDSRPPLSLPDYKDRLFKSLFGLDYSLACIACVPTDFASLPLSSYLLTIKGHADPTRCNPEQLRFVLGAENIFMNLMHTSDTPTDVARESSLFFAKEYGRRLAYELPPSGTACPAAPSDLGHRESVSVFFVLNKLKRSLWRLDRTRRDEQIVVLFDEEERLSLTRPKTTSTYRAIFDVWSLQREFVLKSTDLESSPLRGTMTKMLDENLLTLNIEELLTWLRALKVDVTAWDELILRSQWEYGKLMIEPLSILGGPSSAQ